MTPTTIPTINGLRLVSPEEAGKKPVGLNGFTIHTVLLHNEKPIRCFSGDNATLLYPDVLVDLPKPRTTRPYTRKEVKCGDVFRNKKNGSDMSVVQVTDNDVMFTGWAVGYKFLLDNFQKLTYDPEGREVLGVAGVKSD